MLGGDEKIKEGFSKLDLEGIKDPGIGRGLRFSNFDSENQKVIKEVSKKFPKSILLLNVKSGAIEPIDIGTGSRVDTMAKYLGKLVRIGRRIEVTTDKDLKSKLQDKANQQRFLVKGFIESQGGNAPRRLSESPLVKLAKEYRPIIFDNIA